MEATLQDLCQRVERLEQEVLIMRKEREEFRDVPPWPKSPLTPAERGALLTERARHNAAYESWRLGQIFDEMGITHEPTISRKKVQQLYLEAGFDPEATDFAQGIVAIREE
jgi:hypothetical protein